MAIKTHSVYYPLYEDKEHFVFLITGGRGCEHPDTPIMMADLSVKKIKDIQVGDCVMGDDGTPRCVLGLFRGNGEMYRVCQKNAEDYIVNDSHILTLFKCESAKRPSGAITKSGTRRHPNGRYPELGDVIDIPILEFSAKSEKFKNSYYGAKSGSIPYKEQEVLIDPYLLGLWIGDGTGVFPRITNPEPEIKAWLEDYCERSGQRLSAKYRQGAWHMGIVSDGKIGGNQFLNNLRAYNLIGNKHIPQEYIANSEGNRLRLLAGLLDTDGCVGSSSYYDIIQKNEELAKSIKLIADTLGFRTHISPKRSKIGDKDCGIYYRVTISGDVWRIPCKVARRKIKKENCYRHKSWRVSRLNIEPIGEGNWCGIMLNGNQRYLHADGTITHNSGKSYSASTFIERLTFEYNDALKVAHQILYTRYTMVSAAISVIPEVLEKIEAEGTEMYFKKTRTDITNRMTGATVMFRGINTSSGNQTAKLKSIHGVTTFVVDEAEEWTSEEDFERIMLSIRQQGLQNRIIIIMNPADSNHWVFRRFIEKTHRIEYFDGVPVQISTHPDVCHIHTTYLDNVENLSAEFLKEVLAMKENNPERYAHIVMGRWVDVAEGAVFKHIGIVDKFPEQAKMVARGMDLGYAHDPTAIVRCGIIGNRLYIDELCYKTGMTANDIITELVDEEERGEGGFVYSESADPRLVDEIALGGVIIYPVKKGAGSILAGIAKMQDYEIFVTRRSVNAQSEFRNYVWAKDKDGYYINEPEDHDNHVVDASRYFCLGKILGRVMQPKAVTKDDLGIY